MKPKSKNSNGKLLWILDNGHGIDTPGKRSPLLMDGFYTNREQCQYLLDPAWRTRIAEAHVEAIKEIEEMGPQFFQS